MLNIDVALADAATIVALGASNTYGKGVARNQAYPAQLESILRAKGSNVRVVNAGINGDTTEGMLERLDRAVPNETSAVILQPGGNDRRKGRPDRTADIQSRLGAQGIPVIMLGNGMLRGLPHQPDGQHLTRMATLCSSSSLLRRYWARSAGSPDGAKIAEEFYFAWGRFRDFCLGALRQTPSHVRGTRFLVLRVCGDGFTSVPRNDGRNRTCDFRILPRQSLPVVSA
jgi:acyl-CoA thioesterase-1